MQAEFEYRAFMDSEPSELVKALGKEKGVDKETKDATDLYAVRQDSDVLVKIRHQTGKAKKRGPVGTQDSIDELVDERAFMPVTMNWLCESLEQSMPSQCKSLCSVDEVARFLEGLGLKTADVSKKITHYTKDGVEVEVAEVEIDGQKKYTVSVQGMDRDAVKKRVEKLGIDKLGTKMNWAQAVRAYAK